MLDPWRITLGRFVPARTGGVGARQSLVALVLAAALIPAGFLGRPVRTLTVYTPAVALADAPAAASASSSASGSRSSSTAPAVTTADLEGLWGELDQPAWDYEIQSVQAPPDITAGEPLRVEVQAVSPAGQPLPNAFVEITWSLPYGQFRDTANTNVFGWASATRTLGAPCRGKRCVVAVTVVQGNNQGYAYSVFAPR